MGLILDTSIVIDIDNNVNSTIENLKKIMELSQDVANISFISYAEFMYGLLDKSFQNQAKHIAFIEKFNCVSASKETAKILAYLEHIYEKKGINFSTGDLIIASQAKENNLTLITKDKQFSKIDEIKCVIID